ncbi:Uncharacterized protein DBV15_07425, partial [Temnothorax longispinosus]
LNPRIGQAIALGGIGVRFATFFSERTRSYRSLALERLTRSFLVSRAPGRRKRLSWEGAEFESNLQMEDRVKIMAGVYRSGCPGKGCRSKDHKSAEELSPRNITGAGQADFQ